MDRGVKLDGHPAFVHVLLYIWSGIFGISEFATRIPFVLAGIAGSIYFYYFIKDFVNQKAALLSFAAITVSQLFVLYSQIARPYSMGFFLVAAFAFYWFRLINKPDDKKYIIGFIIFGISGIISHYFASMSISIMLTLGLIFLNKNNYKPYLLSSLGICVLFIPHINITIYQIFTGVKDVIWIPAPTEQFIYDFFLFMANGSYSGLYLILSFPIIALLSAKTNFKQWRIYLLPILFFLPYYIAYQYSLSNTSVLQFSVLIFSSPFLIAFVFSFFSKKSNSKLICLLSIFIIGVGLFTLIHKREFYNKRAFADFRGVSNNVSQWTKKIGSENVIQFSNSNNPTYLDFYYDQDSNQVNFEISQFVNPSLLKEARDIIENSKTEFAMISFANVPVPDEVYELVKQKYPERTKQFVQFNSDVSLFKKSNYKREKLFESKAEIAANWNVNRNLIDTSTYFSEPNSFHIKPTGEYSFSFNDTVKNIFKSNNSLVAKGRAFIKTSQKVLIVISIERNKKNVYWRGMEIQNYRTEGDWFQFLHVFRKEDQIKDTDLVKIYIWNPEKADFYIDDFELVNFKDSNYNYYEL